MLESFAHSRPITAVDSTTNYYQGLKATSQTRRRLTSLTASKTPSQPRSKISSQRPSRTVSSTVNPVQMRPPPKKSNPPLNWSLNWKSRFVSSTIATPWKSATFSTILTRRQLPTCPSTMTLQRLSLSNSSHRRCPRTMTMTTTARSFRWSHRGRHRRCFPSSCSSGQSKRTVILLLLTRL